MSLRSVLTLVVLTIVVAMPQSMLAQTAPVDRPAELRSGTCNSLGDIVVSLSNLSITTGDLQGQAGATPVEQSGTVVEFAVADFLTTAHTVVVQKSSQEPTVVACGDIGGALNPDGTLAVGMLGMNGSGLSGVAYFTPIDTFGNTLVTILLVSSSDPVTVSADDAAGEGDVGLDAVEDAAGAVKDVSSTTDAGATSG